MLRTFVTHTGTATVTVVLGSLEGAKLLATVDAILRFLLDHLIYVEGVLEGVRYQVLNYTQGMNAKILGTSVVLLLGKLRGLSV